MQKVASLIDPLLPDVRWNFYLTDDRLLIETKRLTTGTTGHRSLPRAALPWLTETITQAFWRRPSEGGLPVDQHAVQAQFAHETLELRRGWAIGGTGEPGFTLTNFARLDPLDQPEEWRFSDELLLRGGLLDLLARPELF